MIIPDSVIQRIKLRSFFTHMYLCGSPLADNYQDDKPVDYSLFFVSNVDLSTEMSQHPQFKSRSGSTIVALLTHDRWFVAQDFNSLLDTSIHNLSPHLGDFAVVSPATLDSIKRHGLLEHLKRRTR
jgi:hypothetical protein